MITVSVQLKRILQNLPLEAGVYKMKNEKDEVIYVGKAKNLKKRVSSYFQERKTYSPWTPKLISEIFDIDYVVTKSELEALVLEVNLIKELQPKYNIMMKDGKNFLYLKITTNEDFPRVYTVRKVLKDGARYFGPKTSAFELRQTLDLIRSLFPIRNCNLEMHWQPPDQVKITKKTMAYPCLEYHIKRCIAPCIAHCSQEEYGQLVDQVIRFFEGKTDDLIKTLEKRMHTAATTKKFELAAKLRDKLQAIIRICHRQIVSVPENTNRDVMGFYIEADKLYFNLFMIRSGRLINQENFILDGQNGVVASEALSSFLTLYYEKAVDIPKEILLPIEVEESNVIEDWLTIQKGQKVIILTPQRGEKNALVDLSMKNAKVYADQCRVKWEKEQAETSGAISSLAEILNLKKSVKRLECFDISHLSGTETVGSMVVFENGLPQNADYRKFKLKTTQGEINDVKSMAEVLERRLSYLLKAKEPEELLKQEKITVRKAKQKDLEFISAVIKKEGLDESEIVAKQFLILEKKLAVIGFGRIKMYANNIEELASLWIDPTFRQQGLGRILMEKLILKTKTKRIYICCLEKNRTFYENFGFREIYTLPDIYAEKKCQACADLPGKPVYFVYEKTKPDSSFLTEPDLIIVDGGKGQLSAALAVIKKMSLTIPLAALAKQEEELFMPGKSLSIRLPKDHQALHLVQRIRDEAHRFAITYNRNLRGKKMTQSVLDTIEGIGAKTKSKLLKRFGSVYGIKEANIEEVEKVVGTEVAKRLQERL